MPHTGLDACKIMIDKLLSLCCGEAAVVEQGSHLGAERGVVLVGWARACWRWRERWVADCGQAWDEDLVAEEEDASDGANSVGRVW